MKDETMISIEQLQAPKQIQAVQTLMREYIRWGFDQVSGSEDAPTFQGWEAEVAGMPGIYVPLQGRLLLAIVDGEPAGCILLKPVDEQTGEPKPLYVRPGFRGQQLGWHLANQVVIEARNIGYKKVILDGHHTLKAAHHIYEQVGFQFVTAPPDFPKEILAEVVFMESPL